MDNTLKEIIWMQFGAAIDMLENAVLACLLSCCTVESNASSED